MNYIILCNRWLIMNRIISWILFLFVQSYKSFLIDLIMCDLLMEICHWPCVKKDVTKLFYNNDEWEFGAKAIWEKPNCDKLSTSTYTLYLHCSRIHLQNSPIDIPFIINNLVIAPWIHFLYIVHVSNALARWHFWCHSQCDVILMWFVYKV